MVQKVEHGDHDRIELYHCDKSKENSWESLVTMKKKREKTYRSKTEDDQFGPHYFRVEFVMKMIHLSTFSFQRIISRDKIFFLCIVMINTPSTLKQSIWFKLIFEHVFDWRRKSSIKTLARVCRTFFIILFFGNSAEYFSSVNLIVTSWFLTFVRKWKGQSTQNQSDLFNSIESLRMSREQVFFFFIFEKIHRPNENLSSWWKETMKTMNQMTRSEVKIDRTIWRVDSIRNHWSSSSILSKHISIRMMDLINSSCQLQCLIESTKDVC